MTTPLGPNFSIVGLGNDANLNLPGGAVAGLPPKSGNILVAYLLMLDQNALLILAEDANGVPSMDFYSTGGGGQFSPNMGQILDANLPLPGIFSTPGAFLAYWVPEPAIGMTLSTVSYYLGREDTGEQLPITSYLSPFPNSYPNELPVKVEGEGTGAYAFLINISVSGVTQPSLYCELSCLTVSPPSLMFPTVEPGWSLQIPVTITNTGADCIIITDIAANAAGPFSVPPGTLPLDLSANSSAEVAIEFAPASAGGPFMATLDITPTCACAATISCQGSCVGSQGDFYVRDWTTSPTAYDDGSEPSTDPTFWTTSDVWNQTGDTAPNFNANSQPLNDNPISGSASNYAYVRVSRVAAGPAYPVDIQWFGADWGVGNNFMPIGTSQSITFPSGTTAPMCTSTPWTPGPENDHYCMAVEISSPLPAGSGDVYGTDLAVTPTVGDGPQIMNDNDQAQRNMAIVVVPGPIRRWPIFFYASIHNSALVTRDMTLIYHPEGDGEGMMSDTRVRVVGTEAKASASAALLTLAKMRPGESRFVAFEACVALPAEGELQIHFMEVEKNRVVAGFSQLVRSAELRVASRMALLEHDRTMVRARMILGDERPSVSPLSERNDSDSVAVRSMFTEPITEMRALLERLYDLPYNGSAALELETSLAELANMLASDDDYLLIASHQVVMAKINLFLTMYCRSRGNVADIPQNIRWQREIFGRAPLKFADSADSVVSKSTIFLREYRNRRDGHLYIELIETLLPELIAAAGIIGTGITDQLRLISRMRSTSDPLRLQDLHRRFLYGLSAD